MGDDHHGNGFDRPRVLVASALTGIIAVLAVMDVLSPEYQLGEVTLAAFLGTIAALLGVEIADVIRGGRD